MISSTSSVGGPVGSTGEEEPGALRVDDRGPAGPDVRGPARRSPGAPRPPASRRCSGATTTRAFRAPTDQVTTDAWAVLAGLARETTTIRLGALVSPVTFRHPGNFVKLVTTVDHMSGGRLEVGVGRRLERGDHVPLGLPYPEMDARADLLEDQLELLHGLWTEPNGWSYDGHQVSVRNASLMPRPVDVPGRPPRADRRSRRRARPAADHHRRPGHAPRLPDRRALGGRVQPDVVVAGSPRRRRWPRARRGVPRRGPGPVDADALGDGQRAGGRDQAEVERRTADLRRESGVSSGDAGAWLAERRGRWIVGTPDEARATIQRIRRRPASSGSCSRT